ncbi:hypothetical protein N0V82_008682 [Gnomoniopsis sp. IMI 355080]|nr:hypothetical protein N0V82_008682 [Gnomoniopsis sp. IMI 355080]
MSHIRHISAPNGLDPGPGGNIPPSYQDALKSPVVTASSISASSHQRQRSDQALMEQCWAAVYQAEDGRAGHSITSNDEPATARASQRQSQPVHLSSPGVQQATSATITKLRRHSIHTNGIGSANSNVRDTSRTSIFSVPGASECKKLGDWRRQTFDTVFDTQQRVMAFTFAACAATKTAEPVQEGQGKRKQCG